MLGLQSKTLDISFNVMLGAFVFGFRIVFSGGCKCGWAYRACEGQVHFMIVGVANIVGTMILALSYDYFPQSFTSGVKLNLLQEFSALNGFGVNMLLFLCMLGLVGIYKISKSKQENKI